jgi:hypothetical protein
MFRRNLLVSMLGIVLAFAGCSKETASTEGARQGATTEQQAAHAPANVTPGSHEDWCQEHAVPESQCTLCNPSLSAAFKATGDWCEEHGLPESHCKKCNPDLEIVRPPKVN